MRHVRGITIPSGKEEEKEKRQVKYLYIEADEDHIALQFHKKKGDIRRWKGHGDNGQIIKRVYVHEGQEESDKKRKKLKNVFYFGGLYRGKENEQLWQEVNEYINRNYDTEKLEKIYFQSDGGGWMKKGLDVLGGTFVLDEFHMKKYIRKLVLASGEKEKEEEILRWVKKGERKKLEEQVKEKETSAGEMDRKRLEENMNYIQRNWKGIRMRVKREDGVIGSSTESHISHVLSSRMSSRPMGWSQEGAGKLSKTRIYWKNGGKMEDLIRKKEEKEEKEEEKCCFSAQEILRWERQNQKRNGKYIEALQARISNQTTMKAYFQKAIAGICE